IVITSVSCDKCKTRIEGRFEPNIFSMLDDSDTEFLLVFLRCRGSIKDVEKELGISYPTVRGRLDRLIQSLGLNPIQSVDSDEKVKEQKRKDILEALNKGEISAKDAIEMMNNTNQ
ncbi:MAG TPA: hypothetical protein DDZ89_11735, partial [Clostridiales bacterium]|nr:hypothetical protein [Clostridiales bacterium]